MQTDDFRELAEVEDSMWYFHALNRRMLLPLAELSKQNAIVLDAGCGTGGLIKALQCVGAPWTIKGLDYSPVACSYARQRTSVPIEEGSIDDASVALAEFRRVLKSGGILAINVAAYNWMRSYHDDLMDTRHRFRRSELVNLLRQAGFAVTLSSYANMLLFPLIFARRKIFVPRHPTSDVKPYPPLIDAFCSSMAAMEHLLLRVGIKLPAGNSVFIVARKVDD
jgi:SAM-dependent methyltransferase